MMVAHTTTTRGGSARSTPLTINKTEVANENTKKRRTGVAPVSFSSESSAPAVELLRQVGDRLEASPAVAGASARTHCRARAKLHDRSEERRVGEEGRTREWP